MIKLALKLVVLAVVLTTIAGLLGGWKWKGRPATASQAEEYLVANAPVTDVSVTVAQPSGWTWGHVRPAGWTWE